MNWNTSSCLIANKLKTYENTWKFIKLFISNFHFSSKEELRGASSSFNKNLITCAFCSCSEQLPWFKGQFKSYGPISKLAGSPSANEIFRPYLETDTVSSRSGGGHSSPDPKDFNPSSDANSLPMHVGYFFRSNIHSVVDYEEMIWAHKSCMDWSICASKAESDNPLILVGKALTQVITILRLLYWDFWTSRSLKEGKY